MSRQQPILATNYPFPPTQHSIPVIPVNGQPSIWSRCDKPSGNWPVASSVNQTSRTRFPSTLPPSSPLTRPRSPRSTFQPRLPTNPSHPPPPPRPTVPSFPRLKSVSATVPSRTLKESYEPGKPVYRPDLNPWRPNKPFWQPIEDYGFVHPRQVPTLTQWFVDWCYSYPHAAYRELDRLERLYPVYPPLPRRPVVHHRKTKTSHLRAHYGDPVDACCCGPENCPTHCQTPFSH